MPDRVFRLRVEISHRDPCDNLYEWTVGQQRHITSYARQRRLPSLLRITAEIYCRIHLSELCAVTECLHSGPCRRSAKWIFGACSVALVVCCGTHLGELREVAKTKPPLVDVNQQTLLLPQTPQLLLCPTSRIFQSWHCRGNQVNIEQRCTWFTELKPLDVAVFLESPCPNASPAGRRPWLTLTPTQTFCKCRFWHPPLWFLHTLRNP